MFKDANEDVVKVSSSPSTLYETTPDLTAFIYSEPLFNSFSYLLLSSISPFKYEPDGLDSPAIFAFFVTIEFNSFLYSFMRLEISYE